MNGLGQFAAGLFPSGTGGWLEITAVLVLVAVLLAPWDRIERAHKARKGNGRTAPPPGTLIRLVGYADGMRPDGRLSGSEAQRFAVIAWFLAPDAERWVAAERKRQASRRRGKSRKTRARERTGRP